MDKHIHPQQKKEYVYLLTVLSCVVCGKNVPLPPKNLDWKFLTDLARYNTCLNILTYGVLQLSENFRPNAEIMKILQQDKNLHLVQDTNQSFEIEQLLNCFDKEKIKNVPLKGYIMKDLYPQSDMRTMTDIDILFKINDVEKVKNVFKQCGFKFEHFDDDNQYHFTKAPFTYVEMHSSLVNHKDECFEYYQTIWDKLQKNNDYQYSFNMKPEDFYIFLLEHASNHFKLGGIGLRHLLDIFVYFNKYGDTVDLNYVSAELEKVNLKTFGEKLHSIAMKWFKNMDFETFDLLEEFILLSSTLGRQEYSIARMSLQYSKEKGNSSKSAFFLSSVFPKYSQMKVWYKYLEKAPYLLPYSWIHMWFSRLFILKNVHFKRGLKYRLQSGGEDDKQYVKTILKLTGFENEIKRI